MPKYGLNTQGSVWYTASGGEFLSDPLAAFAAGAPKMGLFQE